MHGETIAMQALKLQPSHQARQSPPVIRRPDDNEFEPRSPQERRLHLDDEQVLTEDGDQIHLASVVHVARWLPVEQRLESARLPDWPDPLRLIPSLPTTSTESSQIVDRNPRPKLENRPLEQMGLNAWLIARGVLPCHVVGPEVQDRGSDAVTVHPVMLVTLSRSDQVSGSRFSSRRPSIVKALRPSRCIKVIGKGCRPIRLSDSSAWKRSAVSPDSAVTASATPYASRS